MNSLKFGNNPSDLSILALIQKFLWSFFQKIIVEIECQENQLIRFCRNFRFSFFRGRLGVDRDRLKLNAPDSAQNQHSDEDKIFNFFIQDSLLQF